MSKTLVPGIYRTPQPEPHRPLGLVRTDIAGFVGMAERGPLDRAVHLTSWDEYRRVFGGFQLFGYLPFAVRGFFENGGVECYAARVVHRDPAVPSDDGSGGALAIWSAGPKVHGAVQLDPVEPSVKQQVQVVGQILPPRAVLYFLEQKRAAIVDDNGLATLDWPLPADQRNAHSQELKALWVEGAAVEDAAVGGETQLTLSQPISAGPGDLVTLFPPGLRQSLTVLSRRGKTIVLRGNVPGDIAAGTPLIVEQSRLRLSASSAGSWGNRLHVKISVNSFVPPRVDISVTLAPGAEGGAPQRENLRRLLWSDLPAQVEANSSLIRVAFDASFQGDPPQSMEDVYEGTLEGGSDNVDSLTVEDYLGDSTEPDPRRWYGLRLLEDQDEIAIVALPDAVYQRVESPPCPSGLLTRVNARRS